MSKKVSRKIFIFAIAFFFVFYFYIQVKNIFIDAMETEYATVVTFDDTLELKCYIVRDETLINSTVSGTYNYVISEGEKLASGQTITNIYSTDSEYMIQERISELNSKIDVLNNSSVEHNYFTLSVPKIDKDISLMLTEYRNQVLSGDYSLATQCKNDLLTTLNKRYLVVNALTGFDDTIATYNDEKVRLTAKSSNDDGTVFAPKSGYFYTDIDGYENILTPELLSTDSVNEIISALNGPPETLNANTVGKIVSEFDWYTICVVDKDMSMLFSSDTYYDVSFPYSVGSTLKLLLVNKVVQSDSDKVVLVFKSSANDSSFNFMRSQIVEIKLDSYEGLRIKKEALRIVDGVEGVYILNGNTVEFKRANKIYENDGYYIISVKDTDAESDDAAVKKFSYLKMYDAVINKGKELYHKKTIG